MIRLGYADCASCHLTPQGAGLLTAYGKAIDEAQSLRAREVVPSDAPQPRLLYDLRFVAGSQLTQRLAQSTIVNASTMSTMLRSSLRLNARHRVTYYMGAEAAVPGRGMTGATTAKIVIPKGLWEYRPTEGVEISAGRDVMPSGIGLPDPQTFIRNGTDPNESRYPTQVKAFIWNNRLQITPYLFGPGGDEPRASRQYGGGVVGGVDLFSHRAIVGLSTRVASAAAVSRRSVGAYARLGFGRWGILAEHDLTARNRITDAGAKADTRHLAGHTQVFVAAKEWLVMSLAAEHLVVDGMTATAHTYRLTPGVQARLSPVVTLLFNVRDVFVDNTAARSRTYSVQMAVKTVR